MCVGGDAAMGCVGGDAAVGFVGGDAVVGCGGRVAGVALVVEITRRCLKR